MKYTIIIAPSKAATHTSAIVLTSPERMNAITIKVKKKINAVPKSFMRKSAPTQPKENIRYLVRLRAL